MSPSSINKYFSSSKRVYLVLQRKSALDQEPDALMSFSTGLFSGDVNPDCALDVGTIIQQRNNI